MSKISETKVSEVSETKISERIFNNINSVVESSVQEILKDVSLKYNIDYKDLNMEFLDKKKKKEKNGYNKYNSKRRKELLKDNKTLSRDFGDMSKIIGEEWEKLTNEEKNFYNKKK